MAWRPLPDAHDSYAATTLETALDLAGCDAPEQRVDVWSVMARDAGAARLSNVYRQGDQLHAGVRVQDLLRSLDLWRARHG